MLDLLTIELPADVPPTPFPWESSDWTAPAVVVFLVLALAVLTVATVLIRRGRR